MLRSWNKLGCGLLAASCAAACVSSGGQSGTEALDLNGKDAAAVRPSSPHASTDAGAVNTDAGAVDSDAGSDPGAFTTADPGADAEADDSQRDKVSADEVDASTQGEETQGEETQGEETQGEETQGEETQGDADPDGGPAVAESFDLYLDYYEEPCMGLEGTLFCPRGSLTGDNYELNSGYEWSDYQWGHVYRLNAHWEAVPEPLPDEAPRTLVVDRVLEDSPVAGGTRFSLQVDPTLDTLGYSEHVTRDPQTGEATIVSGPGFACEEELSDALADALLGGTVFKASFEFDAETKLSLIDVQLLPDVLSYLGSYMQQLERDWNAAAPKQYVVKVCGYGFLPSACTLAAVDSGSVTSAESRWPQEEWMLATPELEPIAAMFQAGASSASFEVDPEYGYLTSYVQQGVSESWGERVTCFTPDTLDLETCRDVE